MGQEQTPTMIDINSLSQSRKLEAKISEPEMADERTARLARENAEAWHQRFRDTTLFFVALAAIAGASTLCVYMLISGRFQPDEKKWAMSLLMSIFTGLIAYVLGKGARSAAK